MNYLPWIFDIFRTSIIFRQGHP